MRGSEVRVLYRPPYLMKIIYVGEDTAESEEKSIFLAGPSPRNSSQEHWRPKAIELLKSYNYDGQIFCPLKEDGGWLGDYEKQAGWELEHLDRANCIMFWIPRDIKNGLYGFTTNVEFGLYAKSGKVVLGYPENADKIKYLALLAKKNDISAFNSLEETIQASINRLNN